MDAGRLNKRIEIKKATEGDRNTFGNKTVTSTASTPLWAMRTDISDMEKISSGQNHNVTMARFTVRMSDFAKTITHEDVLVHEGDWNIKGVKPIKYDNFIEITAIKQ